MRKIICFFISFLIFSLGVFASEIPDFNYRPIKIKAKITYDSALEKWSDRVNKKTCDYYVKTEGFGSYSDYLKNDGTFGFTTNCEYEFLINGSFIGYSNQDLKFYEFYFNEGNFTKRELTEAEIAKIIPEYRIIKFSEFSPTTNSIRIKKAFGDLNLLVLNDSEEPCENYEFSTGNARIKTYDLKGFLTVSKKGMIQFANSSKMSRWYVILAD